MSGMKLYELTAEFARLRELASCDDEPLTAPESLALALDALEMAIEKKADGIAKVLAGLDAEAVAYAAEAKRLKTRGDALARNADRLREYMLASMRDRGIEQIRTPTHTFTVRVNPPKVTVLDQSMVPPEYVTTTTTTTTDKRAVLDAYKAHGEIVAGCDIERGTRLEIK